jgi:hypothetical protein
LGVAVGTTEPSGFFGRWWQPESADEAFLATDAIRNDVVNGFYPTRGWTLTDTHQTREGRSMNRCMKRLDTL